MHKDEMTYELEINWPDQHSLPQIKQDVVDWLISCGEETFVEGMTSADDIAGIPDSVEASYEATGGSTAPISIFKATQKPLITLQEQLEQAFGSQVQLTQRSFPAVSWQEGWKESFHPIQHGMFMVHPPWEVPELEVGAVSLEIDPGMAFGTGQHQTTGLCLQLLSRYYHGAVLPQQSRVLDIGTGSGVLAIAAAKLGYDVMATDIEADAVQSTQQNSQVNGVDIKVYQGTFVDSQQGFDLVMANILSHILQGLWQDLCHQVKPGGFLMVSGILAEHESLFMELFESSGFADISCLEHEGWLCLGGCKQS